MITNANYVSLSESAKMLKMTENKVFELTNQGFLSSREINRRTFIPREDLQAYARRFNVILQEQKKPIRRSIMKDYTVEKAIAILGVEEKEVHKLIQSNKLKAGFNKDKGCYVVYGQSLYNYVGGIK